MDNKERECSLWESIMYGAIYLGFVFGYSGFIVFLCWKY